MTPEIEAAAKEIAEKAWTFTINRLAMASGDIEPILCKHFSPPTLTLPDREGWWWEWDDQSGEWFDPQSINLNADGRFYVETSSQDYLCQPGRWVQCVPPPSGEPLTQSPDIASGTLDTAADPEEEFLHWLIQYDGDFSPHSCGIIAAKAAEFFAARGRGDDGEYRPRN